MKRYFAVLAGLIIIQTIMVPQQTFTEPLYIENNELTEIIPVSNKKIGYYIGSESEYANAVSYIMRYNSFGPYMQNLENFSNLEEILLLIIPYSNLSQNDVELVSNYANSGGIVYFTGFAPQSLFNVTRIKSNGYTLRPDVSISGIQEYNSNCADIDYNKVFRDLKGNYYPADVKRDVYYFDRLGTEFSNIHFADINYINRGPATITKPFGQGRIAFTSAPIFDFFGQKAMGGPNLSSNVYGTSSFISNMIKLINYTIEKLLSMQAYYLPQLWHTPYGKLRVIMSRDDVDTYYEDAVTKRGDVDFAHGIPSIFYELRDDIPENDWETVLDNFHLPGYHRHSGYEQTADQYLERILDIEAESGVDLYFECHHGGGSGWYAQNYVRSAVEATNQLDHPVVYTSSEGGHTNNFLEPYLYKYDNGSILPALNYYAFPKSTTIDAAVNSRDVPKFYNYVKEKLFRIQGHIHFLLHSQNVKSTLLTNYNELLTQVLDPIYNLFYSDPMSFVNTQINNVQNVESTFSQNENSIQMNLHAKEDINGYSIILPLSDMMQISSINLDGNPILNQFNMLKGEGYSTLFYINMTKGDHVLNIEYQNSPVSFPDDQDSDLIPDFLEPFLNMNPLISDSDEDGVVDGLEYFRYGSDLNSIDSDSDGLRDDEEMQYGTQLRSKDTDFDIMDDKYEIERGHNPLFYDSHLDDDNDGISNYDEYLIYINKVSSSSSSISSSTSSGTTTSSTSSSTNSLSSTSSISSPQTTRSDSDPISTIPPSSTQDTEFALSTIVIGIMGLLIVRTRNKRKF
ncbi:MAG: hypothetical protein INQ03_23335 [Candidatus Heimdallarchaeota archaeon]|nr:hypothetical protein [Candidatus Heimdallarchaeota archaeon]